MMNATRLGVGLVMLAGACSAATAEPVGCLSQEQRRAAIAGRQAIPLGKALESARARVNGEVLRARLCHHEKGLVYMLTLLAHDGKVTRVTIDGASGAWIRGR